MLGILRRMNYMLADLSDTDFSDSDSEEEKTERQMRRQSDSEEEKTERQMRRQSGETIKQLIVNELQERHYENASEALRDKLLPDLIRRVADEAGRKQISEVYLHFRSNRARVASSADPHIDWHVDIRRFDKDKFEKNVNGIIDLLVTDRLVVSGKYGNTKRFLEMHGLGGECKNLDGEVTHNADQNFGSSEKRSSAANKTKWGRIEFWTATFRDKQVSILKGTISYTEFTSGGSRELSTETVTRFSICPLIYS
jgi:hypothetical protein